MRNQDEFQTNSDVYFVLKLWLPLILLAGMSVVLRQAHHAYALGLPIALWAVFNLSAAQVKAGDQVLKYRRLFRWKQVAYEEIRECKVSWLPALGFLRLRQFVPPWGKVYFVLEAPLQWAVPGGQTGLTTFISSRSGEGRHSDTTRDDRDSARRGVLVCLVMAVVGALSSAIASLLSLNLPAYVAGAGLPRWIVFWEQIGERTLQWPWDVVAGVLLAGCVICLRFRNRAWILSFGLGGLLGFVLTKAPH